MVEDLARIPVEVDYADKSRYRDPIAEYRTLVGAVIQPGESIAELVAMAEARRRGAEVPGMIDAT